MTLQQAAEYMHRIPVEYEGAGLILNSTLQSRGLSKRQEATFQIGILPEIMDDVPPMYSSLKGRVTFPIQDPWGSTVSIEGRDYTDDGRTKYWHIPFDLSSYVYNLHRAKRRMSETNKCFVCESFFDVFAFHALGIENCVSLMGPNLHEKQAVLLSRYADTFFLFHHLDAPGLKGFTAATETLKELGLNSHIVTLKSTSGCNDVNDFLIKDTKTLLDIIATIQSM